MIWPLFKFQGRICQIFTLVLILVQTMTPKEHFEINWRVNWPLVKLSSLNHCAQVALLNFDFFNKKWWLLFKTTKEIPGWHKPETGVNSPCGPEQLATWLLPFSNCNSYKPGHIDQLVLGFWSLTACKAGNVSQTSSQYSPMKVNVIWLDMYFCRVLCAEIYQQLSNRAPSPLLPMKVNVVRKIPRSNKQRNNQHKP